MLVAASIVASAGAGDGASAASNLTCATQIVNAWTLPQLANETIAVPVYATNIGAMGPAARAGYGGLLLFGSTAPPTLAPILATLQRQRPGHYALVVMTDEEGGGVVRLTNLVGSFPWAQTMGKNLTAAQITAVGVRVGKKLIGAGVNTDLAPVLDVDGRAQEPGAANPDGYRSFSGDPAIAATDGTAFMKGLSQAGVLSVVKHRSRAVQTGHRQRSDRGDDVQRSSAWPLLASGRTLYGGRAGTSKDTRLHGTHRHRFALRRGHQRAALGGTGGLGAGPRGGRRPDPLRLPLVTERIVGTRGQDFDRHCQRRECGNDSESHVGRCRRASARCAKSIVVSDIDNDDEHLTSYW